MFICMRLKETKDSSKLDILVVPLRHAIESGDLIAIGIQKSCILLIPALLWSSRMPVALRHCVTQSLIITESESTARVV